MSEALARIENTETALDRPHPREVIRQATEEANELASVIESRKLYAMIQGRKFVKCEGWTTLACLRGCLPREIAVTEAPEGRYIATVELIRMSDGLVLTRASAECGGPEDPIWQNRPPNARRSMAITRATGKACRVAFSWVMALAGFEVTPLEEMPADAPTPHKSENQSLRESRETVARGEMGLPRAHGTATPEDCIVPFGDFKGKHVSFVPNVDLKRIIAYVEKNLLDPEKAKFAGKNKQLLDGMLTEINRRLQPDYVGPTDEEDLVF